MDKKFSMKHSLAKRILSFLMIFVVFMASVPEVLTKKFVDGVSSGISRIVARAAEADGWYWDDTTLYIKDGSITKGELYSALSEKYGTPSSGNLVKGYYYGRRTTNTTSTSDTAEAGLGHNASIEIWKTTGSGWTASQSSQGLITVKHYYVIDTAVATNSPDGAGISVSAEKVVKGDTVEITVDNVDGYTASVADSKGNAVTNLAAYQPTESTTLTVTYTSNEVAKYKVTVNTVNGEYGTATLKSEAELPAGAEALVEVTPKTSTNTEKYEIVSVKVGSVDLSKNANGYYVYTMGEENVTITVTFSTASLVLNSGIEAEFNAKKSVADQLDNLKQEIFKVVNAEGSLPSNEIKYTDLEYSYYPWKVGKITGNSEYESTAYELTYEKPDEEIIGVGYEYRNFGERFAAGGTATEKVLLTGKAGTEWAGLSVATEITLVEAREKSEIYYTDQTVTFETQADIDTAVLNALSAQSTGEITVAMVEGQTLPTGGQTATLTYNVTVAEDENYLGNTTTVTITATAVSNPAGITFTSAGTGSGSLTFGNLTESGTLATGTYTLTVTPSDLDGTDGSAMYVEKVEVNGEAINGTWENGVFTASISVENDESYTIKITYGTATLTNQGGVLGLNGYGDKKFENLKNNIITAVLGGGVTNEYNVHIWLDLSLGDPKYVDLDNTSTISDWTLLTTVNKDRLKVPAYGETGTLKVKIVKAASSNGQIVALTLADTNVTTKESREKATVISPSQPSAKFDTKEAFLDALKTATKVYDNDNQLIAVEDSGLTLTATWNENQCTVAWNVANDGATWLANNGDLGTYTWNISVYKVTFKNDDGTVISEKEYPYGTTTDGIVVPADPTKADKVDENGNVMATYTFAAWNPTVDTVTGHVEYTATYTEVAQTYTVTWKNGDGETTETYEYGETPTAPTASKTSTAQYHFINGTWGEIATVTGNATYTATFTEVLRSYTVTFEDYNGNVLDTQTVSYGDAATAPADPTRAADDTYTYVFAGWDKAFDFITGELTVAATYSGTYIDYEVKWDIDGNVTTNKYHYNDTVVVPENPTKEDYYFLGWDVNGDGEYTEGESVPAKVTGNITITAIFAAKPVYAVVVKYDNGTAEYNYTVIEGNTTTVPAAPTKTGYTFNGWYVNGGNVEVGATLTITGNTTITATWTINQYTITFVDWNDNVIATIEQDYATVVTAPADPTRTGYTFKGWDTTVPANMPANNMTIKATYEINKYTITWINGDGETTTETYEYGETPVPPTASKTSTAQYHFTNGTWGTIATVTGDATYTATFDEQLRSYTVKWIVDGTTTTETYDYGTTPAFTGSTEKATVNYIGYTFVGWDNEIATVTGDATYTAQYTATLLATDGTVAINGYYESRLNQAIFGTLKADVLTAAGLTGVNASNYTVTVNLRGTYYNLDEMTGTQNALNWGMFFAAVEVPESGRQFTILDNSTGVSKTVTMAIVDSRPSAGLVNKEFTEVKVLGKDDDPTDYVNTLVGQVNPNGLNVTVTLTEGTWPPAQQGVTYKYVYTVSYESDANYIGGSAKLTVYMQSLLYNCTVSMRDSSNGSLTVNGSSDNMTVAGNSSVSITVKPNSDKIVETITVYKNGTPFATYTTDQINYSNQTATVSFTSDGAEQNDEYTVEVEYSDKYLNLNENQTIVYCYDDTDHTYDLQEMVFNAIFGGSSAPMNKDNVTLKYAYIGVGGINLWADVSSEPAINLGNWTHKFGEEGSETIQLTYTHDKYGEFEKTVVLNVFDACYSATVEIETVAPQGTEYGFSVKYSEDARAYQGENYFKKDVALMVTLTPSGDDILAMLNQIYNQTYSDSAPYIKTVTVYAYVGDAWTEVSSTLVRASGELIDWDDIWSGIGNPMAYTTAVTFTPEDNTQYKIVAEYGVLELERSADAFEMEMYQGGNDYNAKVPSAQDIVNAMLGEDYANNFLATYGGAFTVQFSTDNSNWNEVTDTALLALDDGAQIVARITWNPTEDNKTYYPLSTSANITLVDGRTATSVQGEVPTAPVEYVDQEQLIENLKNAMGLGIFANGSLIEVTYDVAYNVEGNYATVIVTYYGSPSYKPCEKTFENVPVADIPDNSTIQITIQNALDTVTNNAGTLMSPDSGVYTVIGKSTYHFEFTPVNGKAIASVSVNGTPVALTYKNGVARFSYVLDEKGHYEIIVETVDSVFVEEDERVYNFAYGVWNPVNEDIVDAAISTPRDIDYSKVSVEYLARAEGTVTVQLPDVDLGFTVIELGTFDIQLGELWLDPNADVVEYDVDKLARDLVNEVIDLVSHGKLAVNEVEAYITQKLKGLTIGAHKFGSAGDGSIETIRLSYADDKYTLEEFITDVTIYDHRIATQIQANDCTLTYGYSLEQLLAASGAALLADGTPLSNANILTNDLYLHANKNAQEITLYFLGSTQYRPCSLTINVIVNKASVDIDYDSRMVTYGDEYDFALSTSLKLLPDGRAADVDMIEFMIGLEMNKLLDFGAQQDIVGLGQAVAYIQMRLPKSIRELPLVGERLQGEFTLAEFAEAIGSLSDLLGIDEGSLETLNQVVEAITGITNRMDIKIVIKDEALHPTNVGVYIAGAVTVDNDFETAYTADYLVIAPKTHEIQLGWNENIDNYVTTLPYWTELMDKGASAVGETPNDFAVKYLLLGINDDTSEFLSTDIYGKIKANIWLDPSQVKSNGVYVQIAYGVLWGNDLYYTMPLVRTFAIVPDTVDVVFKDNQGNETNDMTVDFTNQPQGFDVYVNGVLANDDPSLTVYYVGIQSNGKLYNSTQRPVHAGVYGVVATYIQIPDGQQIDLANVSIETLYQLFDVANVGANVGIFTILPVESDVTVDNVIETFDPESSYDPKDQVTASSSADKNLTVDTTVITVGIGTNGTYSENGWSAVNGKANVDLPRWIDELLAQYAPNILDGITVPDFAAQFGEKLPVILAALEEQGASAEILNQFTNTTESVLAMLDKLPSFTTLSFEDDFEVSLVGAYAVIAIVTDSDHYPSIDAGILVVAPDCTTVKLAWNYEDCNGLFTRDLLEFIDYDLWASAYADGVYNETATNKITYQFIGFNSECELVIYKDPTVIPNGTYVQLAYIEFELDGMIYISDMIARPVVIMPSNCNVEIENTETVFDGTQHGVNADVFDLSGNAIDVTKGELTYIYSGLQTNGLPYFSKEMPTNAGLYEVVAIYLEYDENGDMRYYGVSVGYVLIRLAQSDIDITGGECEYVEDGYSADVTVISSSDAYVNYIVISGGTYTSNGISEVGVDAFYGNVNVDLPIWLDEKLATVEAFKEGISSVYFINLINSYRDNIVSVVPAFAVEEANAVIDELISVLDKMPANVTLTFNDNVVYTVPGQYLYFGIVADFNHYLSMDTGLLVIEKADGIEFDILDSTVNYNGAEQIAEIINPNNENAIIVVVDRSNNAVNVLLNNDATYVVELLADILGYEYEGAVVLDDLLNQYGAQTIANAVSKLIAKIETLEENEEVVKVLAAIRRELETLPSSGSIAMNGELPVNVGEYEVYAVVYSRFYHTVSAQANFEIKPAEVTVTVTADNIHVGELPNVEIVGIDDALAETLNLEIVYKNASGNIVTEFNVPGIYTASVVYTENENYNVTVVDATFEIEGHIVGVIVVENNVAPTCTEGGSYDNVVYCTVCNEELSRETVLVPENGHTAGSVEVENNVAPTCTEGGSYDNVVYCTVCGEELSRETVLVPENGHTAGSVEVENNVAPTCTEGGSYDNVVYCTVCNEELSRETVPVSATGHTAGSVEVENNVAPTCTEGGSYDNVVYCTVCGEELSRETLPVPEKGHTAGRAVVENNVEPTDTEDGSYENVVYCTVCGEELSREKITVPATGNLVEEDEDEDSVNILLIGIAAGVLSALSVAFTIVLNHSHKKKYKNKKSANAFKDGASSQSSASDGATATEEGQPAEIKESTVSCPKCNTHLKLKDDGAAYICPNCNTLLRMRTNEKRTKDVTGTTAPKTDGSANKGSGKN